MSLQDGSPHEAGSALQKWKKKLRKAFGAISINEGKQPESRLATLEEDPSKVPLPATPKRLERTPPTKRGADRDAFGTTDASPYLQDSHMVTPRSTSRIRRMDAEDEGSRGRRGGARASRNGSGRRQTNTDASSCDDGSLLPPVVFEISRGGDIEGVNDQGENEEDEPDDSNNEAWSDEESSAQEEEEEEEEEEEAVVDADGTESSVDEDGDLSINLIEVDLQQKVSELIQADACTRPCLEGKAREIEWLLCSLTQMEGSERVTSISTLLPVVVLEIPREL
ncbi:hypothetical protein PI124_g22790 [Phytophthora idaei]|nr:hypothetical protein PI125_g26244 [Phytophthora idaei]KAG3232121.1 hypothetical protein PI124_g22790 [Phytophthora idaei]